MTATAAVEVSEEAGLPMAEYESVPISFTVDRVLNRVTEEAGRVGIFFAETPVAEPYVKDYDQLGGRPTTWGDRWDLSNWGIFAARQDGALVGTGAVAFRTPGVHLLEDRDDVSVLWDLRVAPSHRGSGVGRRLFEIAVEWSRAHGARVLKIETQNVNVAACRFYARWGCSLVAVDSRAYPELPHEWQLMWALDLA